MHVEVHYPKFESFLNTDMWMEPLGLCLMLEQLYTDWVFRLNKSIMFGKQNNSEAHLPFERREMESTAFCEWTLKAARTEANVMQISRHV